MLAERYWPELHYLDPTSSMVLTGDRYKVDQGLERGRLEQTRKFIRCSNRPEENYMGLPYITFTPRGPLLGFYREVGEGVDNLTVSIEQQMEDVKSTIKQYQDTINQLGDGYLMIRNLPGTELIY